MFSSPNRAVTNRNYSNCLPTLSAEIGRRIVMNTSMGMTGARRFPSL
jgi:hypothetical protein